MNLRKIPALAIVLFLSFVFVCTTAEAKYRTWTDAQERTVTAEFVRINNGNVVLKQNNGKVISVPFYSLSEDDQDFVRELLEAKGLGEQAPRKRPSGFDFSQKNAPGMGMPLGAGNMPPGANAPGANGVGANGVGGAPPLGPGRMPPGMGAAAGHQPGGPYPAGAFTPPGTAPNMGTPTPPGTPGAPVGSNPGAGNPSGSYPPGAGYPGRGPMPGMNPSGSGATPMPGTNGPGMNPLASSYPQNTSTPQNTPTGPIGVSPVTPGLGGAGTPQMQWVEIKTCDKCKKEVPATSKAGDRCPHCGTYWGYETGQNGEKTYAVGYRAGKVIGGIIFLLALIGTGIKKLMSR